MVILPVRSEGSRWIRHKCEAMQRLVDRYAAYVHHLAALAEDRSIKSVDRSHFKDMSRNGNKLRCSLVLLCSMNY